RAPRTAPDVSPRQQRRGRFLAREAKSRARGACQGGPTPLLGKRVPSGSVTLRHRFAVQSPACQGLLPAKRAFARLRANAEPKVRKPRRVRQTDRPPPVSPRESPGRADVR